MTQVRIVSAMALAILALCVLNFVPGIYRRNRAKEFAQFAEKGVIVQTAGQMQGNGNPILVPTGVGLLLADEFELVNDQGEKRNFVLCNGHPDYWKLMEATPMKERKGHRVRLVFSATAVSDEHYDENHLGFARYLRVEPIRETLR